MQFRLTKIQLFFVAVFVGLAALLVTLMVYSLLGVGYSKEPTFNVDSENQLSENGLKTDSLAQEAKTAISITETKEKQLYVPDIAREECQLPYSDQLLMAELEYNSDEDSNQIEIEVGLATARKVASLSKSQDGEHLVMASLLESTPSIKIELAKLAVEASPDNPVVLWSAIGSCSGGEECPREQWLKQLAVLDRENGGVWMSLAAHQWRNENPEQALKSLERASHSSQHSTYWVESIEMSLRAYLSVGDETPFYYTTATAMSEVAAANLPDYQAHVDLCRKLGDENPSVARVCLHYAQRTGALEKTHIGQAIAGSMEIIALEQLGQIEEAKELRKAKDAMEESNLEMLASQSQGLSEFIGDNPTNFQSYLDAIRIHGEIGAVREMAKEKQAFEKAYLPASCFTSQD